MPKTVCERDSAGRRQTVSGSAVRRMPVPRLDRAVYGRHEGMGTGRRAVRQDRVQRRKTGISASCCKNARKRSVSVLLLDGECGRAPQGGGPEASLVGGVLLQPKRQLHHVLVDLFLLLHFLVDLLNRVHHRRMVAAAEHLADVDQTHAGVFPG